jgi:hypothetical protein
MRFILYSVVSPSLSLKKMLVPTSTEQEVPELDMNYCDPHRHSLSTIPASTRPSLASAHDSSCCRFPRVDAPEHVGYQVGPHRVRTTAQRLWLWGSLQRTIVLCGESLELSRDLGFPRVPRHLGFPSSACRITAASSALLCRTGSAVAIRPRCETYSLSFMSGPNPLARSAVSSSPSTSACAESQSGSNRVFQL